MSVMIIIQKVLVQPFFYSGLVLGAVTENAQIDNRGITVIDDQDGSKQVRITSGGIFVSSDGGNTWHNAIRGDGITADVITAGSINTSQITIYDENAPSFVWDANGISAYLLDQYGVANENQYVRFDKYGLYGVNSSNVVINSEQDVWDNASFGFTWNKFFLKNKTSYGGVEISSDSDILVTVGSGNSEVERVKIGNLGNNNYGIRIKDARGNPVFVANSNGVTISGSVTMGSSTVEEIEATANNAVSAASSYTDAQIAALQIGGENLIRFTETPTANNGALPSTDDGGYVPGSESSDISDSPISIEYIDSLF